ncbi:MAG TPA: hypothetical protein VMD09_05190 [Solirubrobacteraceae bacterium]|nr:hypothetical protein [Solirubrobacteraceae bacterium]
MKRFLPVVLTLVTTCGLGAWAAVAPAGARTSATKLQLRKTSVGTILVNSRGYTVYAYSKDSRNRDNCQKSSTCIRVWPPVTTSGSAIAGPGVKASLIGTIKTKNGAKQLTYAGHPLYTYIADTHPAQTSNINIFVQGGRWPALNASGQEVK